MEQKPTNNATEATLDEVSGDWIRDQLKGVPEVVPPVPLADQSQTLVLKDSTPKEERGREDSVTELASALLDVTTRPLQALAQDWSSQLAALQSQVDEGFDVVEEVTTNVARFEVAIEGIREAQRGTESRAERAENQTKESLEKFGSLETLVSDQLQQLTASIEQIRNDVAAQEQVFQELRRAEERRAQAVEKLEQIFGGVQEAVGLLATPSNRPPSESESG